MYRALQWNFLLDIIDSEKVLLYLYDRKLIPYVLRDRFVQQLQYKAVVANTKSTKYKKIYIICKKQMYTLANMKKEIEKNIYT